MLLVTKVFSVGLGLTIPRLSHMLYLFLFCHNFFRSRVNRHVRVTRLYLSEYGVGACLTGRS
jgi:hypothetical protein